MFDKKFIDEMLKELEELSNMAEEVEKLPKGIFPSMNADEIFERDPERYYELKKQLQQASRLYEKDKNE